MSALINVKKSKKELAAKDYVRLKFKRENMKLTNIICDVSCVQCRQKRDILFMQGDEGNYIYYLMSGLIKLFRVNEEGREVVIKFIHPGETFAEGVIGGNYPVCAVALEKSELLAIEMNSLKREVYSDISLVDELFRNYNKEINYLVSLIDSLALTDTRKRLEKYLRELSKRKKSKRVRLPVPKCELALLLGSTPENLSRIMKQMSDDGEITTAGRDIIVKYDNEN